MSVQVPVDFGAGTTWGRIDLNRQTSGESASLPQSFDEGTESAEVATSGIDLIPNTTSIFRLNENTKGIPKTGSCL